MIFYLILPFICFLKGEHENQSNCTTIKSKTCSEPLISSLSQKTTKSEVLLNGDKCVNNSETNWSENSVSSMTNNCCNDIKSEDLDQTNILSKTSKLVNSVSETTNNCVNQTKHHKINGQTLCHNSSDINKNDNNFSKPKSTHLPSKSSIVSSIDTNSDKRLESKDLSKGKRHENTNNSKLNDNTVNGDHNCVPNNDKNNNSMKSRLDSSDVSNKSSHEKKSTTNESSNVCHKSVSVKTELKTNCEQNNCVDRHTDSHNSNEIVINNKQTLIETNSVAINDCKAIVRCESNCSQTSDCMPRLQKQTSSGKSSNSMCSKCRRKSVSNVRIQCKMDQYLSSRLQSLPPQISLSLLTPRLPLPAPDLLNLKYGKYYRVEHYPNGMAKVLHLYWDEIIHLTVEEKNELSLEFLKESFREETPNVAKYVISIVHNAASYMPDLLEYFTDAEPHLTVKAGVLGHSGSDIETTTMQTYRDNVCIN